jgi:DNA-binding NarL/FixJ family response regulator
VIRVLLADDHAIVREGIKAVLRSDAEIEVVGEAASGDEALRQVLALRPDVLVLDLTMPAMNGMTVVERLRLTAPATRILVLSMHHEPEYVRPGLRAGAQGYLVKGAGIEDLTRAIHVLMEGGEFLDPKAREALESDSSAELSQLTPRETEILVLVAGGATNREIAQQLGLSPKTVDAHRTSLMNKLDLHNAQAVTRFALRWGLLK